MRSIGIVRRRRVGSVRREAATMPFPCDRDLRHHRHHPDLPQNQRALWPPGSRQTVILHLLLSWWGPGSFSENSGSSPGGCPREGYGVGPRGRTARAVAERQYLLGRHLVGSLLVARYQPGRLSMEAARVRGDHRLGKLGDPRSAAHRQDRVGLGMMNDLAPPIPVVITGRFVGIAVLLLLEVEVPLLVERDLAGPRGWDNVTSSSHDSTRSQCAAGEMSFRNDRASRDWSRVDDRGSVNRQTLDPRRGITAAVSYSSSVTFWASRERA